jgi:LysM repeat protein
VSAASWQGQQTALPDRSSLLYSLVAGEEVTEGPLDPAAYASTDAPGIGGDRLAALDASAGIGLITFDDPEVNFANTLGGNAVLAPLSPLVPEPGSSETARPAAKKPTIYTVQEGDTIASIAAEFNISSNTVLWANGLDGNDVINAGDYLTILPTTGVLHTVASGDTLLAIANTYDVDAKEVAQYNGLADTHSLSIGQKLIVPDGYLKPRQAPVIVPDDTDTQIAADTPPPAASDTAAGFVWPTTTKHISQYFRWGHTGIDIDNRARPAVYAATAGTVEFAGWLGGYGKLIILNHGNGLTTYYAHLDQFYVGQGQQVDKGAAVGKMGSTGRSTGPHVHFEVRKNGRPVNPLGMY